MKILEISRSFYPSIGGMEKFVSDRLKIYEKLGYDYQVVTTTHSEKKLAGSKYYDNVIYLPSYTPYEIVPSLQKAMEMDYDVLSINQLSYYYAWQAVNKAWRQRKKIILTPHFYFHTKRFKITKSLHNKIYVPQILKKADRIICFTEYEGEYWQSAFPFLKNKLTVIPHYFDAPKTLSGNMKNEFNNYFLFLGRGEKNKRVDLLIKAFTEIRNEYQLILTLDKDEIKPTLRSIVNEDKRIHLLGRVSEEKKQSLLQHCTALVLPSDFEAFGIVNLEASYYSKPLLITNLSVFKNILDEKGVIYFDNNLKSIKNTLEKFIKLSEEEKKRMGKVNKSNLDNYKFNKVLEKYFQLFAGLLEK